MFISGGGKPNCCNGRIELQGDASPQILEENVESANNLSSTSALHLAESYPFLDIACKSSDCALTAFDVQPTANLIEDEKVTALDFERDALSKDAPQDAAIESGAMELYATDLMGNRFKFRTIKVPRGTQIVFPPKLDGQISVDMSVKGLVVQGSISTHGPVFIRERADSAEDITPSILENSAARAMAFPVYLR